MSDPPAQSRPLLWSRLVQLGRQLLRQADPGGRREIIRHTAEDLLACRATVWLDERRGRSPVDWGERLPHPDVASDAMRRAGLTRRTQREPNASRGSLLLAVPIVAGDCLLGVVLAEREDGSPFAEHEIGILEALAGQAAIGLEAAWRVESERWQAQEQAWVATVTHQVAGAVQRQPSLNKALETVARLVPMLTGSPRCALLLLDDDGAGFVPRAGYGLTLQDRADLGGRRLPSDGVSALEELLATGRRVAAGALAPNSPLYALGFRSPIALPLFAGGAISGALVIDATEDDGPVGRSPPDAPGGQWLEVAQAIAQQTSAAIENRRLRHSQEEEAYVSTALLQVVQAIATLEHLGDVLTTVVRITPALVGVERCAILLWSDEHGVFYSAPASGVTGADQSAPGGLRVAPGELPLLDAVRRQQRPLSERGPGADAMPPGWRSAIPISLAEFLGLQPQRSSTIRGLPLAVRGSFYGVMVVVEGDSREGGEVGRHQVLQGIADQAAIAIQNDRLHTEIARRERLQQEMELARDIQRDLMPERLPKPRGWELAAVCRPAREVGGDFFDVLELPEGHLGLVIADVADKGIPAALFMANTRAMVRALARQGAPPAAVLGQVNMLLLPDSHRGMFVTAFYARLSLQDGTLGYCNAGHNPPLVWRANTRQVVRLDKGGTALGVLDLPKLVPRSACLQPGDCLVLYTDGVTEACSAGGESFYGEERLRAVIATVALNVAEDVVAAIQRSVDEFAVDAPQSDDLTLLVIRRTEGGSVGG